LSQAAIPVLVTKNEDHVNKIVTCFLARKLPIEIGVGEIETVLLAAPRRGRLLAAFVSGVSIRNA